MCDKSDEVYIANAFKLVNAFSYWHGGVFYQIEKCEEIKGKLSGLPDEERKMVCDVLSGVQCYLSDVFHAGELKKEHYMKTEPDTQIASN